MASFKCTIYWYELNYLSNITPQKSWLNRGLWLKLEKKEREVARKTGKNIYVITGPLYEHKMPSLPMANESHKIPSGYWKVLAIQEDKIIETAAFIFDQKIKDKSTLINHITTIDEIEKRAGLNLFWELPDDVEESIESDRHMEWILTNLLN